MFVYKIITRCNSQALYCSWNQIPAHVLDFGLVCNMPPSLHASRSLLSGSSAQENLSIAHQLHNTGKLTVASLQLRGDYQKQVPWSGLVCTSPAYGFCQFANMRKVHNKVWNTFQICRYIGHVWRAPIFV